MKVLTVIGARPQFIKAAPVSRALRKRCKEIVVHTGQHYDDALSGIFFRELRMAEPDYNLNVGSASHAVQTAHILEKIEKILSSEKPDLVLLYGDTNSTLAGSVAAAKLKIPFAHIEAGMRGFDRTIPEEVNRIVTDHLANIHFCATETAVKNLKNEGVTENVFFVGDVMCEALMENSEMIREKSGETLKRLGAKKPYILATIHRQKSTDREENLRAIVEAFKEIASHGKTIVFPVHPRTDKMLKKFGLLDSLSSEKNITLIPPVGYLDSLTLTMNSDGVITDSGGILKEAYMLGKPLGTAKTSTEWIETVNVGWNVLVGTDRKKIVDRVMTMKPLSEHPEIFKYDGASEAIAEKIASFLKE